MKMHGVVVSIFIGAVTTGLLIGDTRRGFAQNSADEKEVKGLFDRAMVLRNQGKYAEALPLIEKAAKLAPQAFGPDHLNTASILHTTASIHQLANNHRAAESYFRASLAIREAKLPKDDMRIAASLSSLGFTLLQLGKLPDAESALQRCLNIRLTKPPNNALDLAIPLYNIASVCQELGKYQDAERHLQKCLQIREQMHGADHVEVSHVLHNMSDLYRVMGQANQAEKLALRSLHIREAKLDKLHLDISHCCNELGLIYFESARFKESEAYYRRALEIREKQPRPNQLSIATVQSNLALTLGITNRLGEAEVFTRRALAIREAALGPDHVLVAGVLSNLAVLISQTGRDEEAVRHLHRSLTIYETKLGKDHPDLLPTLNNLAGHYCDANRFKEADQLYRRILAIQEARSEKSQIVTTLNNFAVLCMRTQRLAEAEAHLQRCVRITEERLGKDHDSLALVYANLGSVYRRLKNYAKADESLERGIGMLEAKRGKGNADIGMLLHDRASLNNLMNRSAHAVQLQERCLEIHLAQLRDFVAFGSEATMLDYVEARRRFLEAMVNMAGRADADPVTVEAALTWTLRLKGAVFDTLCKYRQIQQAMAKDDSLSDLVAKYRSRKEFLANASLSPAVGVSAEKYKTELTQARQEIEQLEKELNRSIAKKWPNLLDEREKTTPAQVRDRLESDSVLIEFVHTPVRDFKRDVWLGHHYFAFVVAPGKNAPKLIDLGSAKDIDERVESLRKEFIDFQEKLAECETADEAKTLEKMREAPFKEKSAALHATLMAPLAKAIGDAKMLHIAADGSLNRLPFECLVSADGKYLIERHRCAYLSSGRDLLRKPGSLAKGTVVFAGPDYKLDATERLAQAEKLLNKKETAIALRNLPGGNLRSAGFKALPGAAAEATDIQKNLTKSAYGPVKTYVGAEALEEVLKAMPAPRILHLATHGFFLDREIASPESADDLNDAGAGSARNRLKRVENPLLRSGIVLAGANTIGDKDAPAKVEDGWVTAEEIALLNLRGTELVVLSACQTGLGDIKTGEGVYGLRRAFLHAGAQTLVTSLFEVPDAETRELMHRFYTGVNSGQGKLRALQGAQLGMIEARRQARGAAHPFFWASFVLVGNSD